jgi:hypothetical protein
MLQDNEQKTAAITFPVATYQVKDIAWTIGLLVAAIIFPALLAHSPQNQWLTGTIVNSILFIAVWRVGIVNAAVIAALPSTIALERGLLPAPMAALIPYIILANIIMVAIFYFLSNKTLLGIISASVLKFAFLFALTAFFIKVTTPLAVMMQWPQLFTALAGGLVAIGTIKLLQK